MSGGDVWGVVLVKPFSEAKQRLTSVLDAVERAELARVMLEDVLTALNRCRHRLAGVIVVTADEEAAALAKRHRAVVLMETAAVGMNAAIGRVVDRLEGVWDAGMVVVPADLPQVTAEDIEEVIDLIRSSPAVALVRASQDGGTNILACRPAGVIAPSFGQDSFNRHCFAAARVGITPTVRFAPRLGLDIDRPGDLLSFLTLESGTRTHAYLSTLPIRERVPVRRIGRGLGRVERSL